MEEARCPNRVPQNKALDDADISAILESIHPDVSDVELQSSDDEWNNYALPCDDDASSGWDSSDDVPLGQTVTSVDSRSGRRVEFKHTDVFSPSIPAYSATVPIFTLKKPYDYFQRWLSDDFFESVAHFTNMRGVITTGNSFDTNCNEVKRFLGCSIYISLIGLPRLHMFWAARTRIPMIADYMTRDRFKLLRTNLKVVDDNSVSQEERKADRFWKVRRMLQKVREACLSTPRTKEVSIDEQMIPFHGHVAMRQYIRGKPSPVGLKVFVMTSSAGLPLDFDMYEGRGTSYQSTVSPVPEKLDVGGKVVLKLCDSLPAGTSVFFDQYFTSVPLLDALRQRDIAASGTIMTSRIPKNVSFLNDTAMKRSGRGSHDQVVRFDDHLAIVKWFDNRGIYLASTEYGVQEEDDCRRWSKKENKYITIKRPALVRMYNRHMGGVDMLDRIISKYAMRTRTSKWTIRTIFHFFDFCLAASWLQYRQDARHPNSGLIRKDILDYFNFRLDIAENLIHSPVSNVGQEELSAGSDEDEPVVLKQRKIEPLPHAVARTCQRIWPESKRIVQNVDFQIATL